MMKQNIGNVLVLYPIPAVAVDTRVNRKVNGLLVAHVEIIGHNQIMLERADYRGRTGEAGTPVIDETIGKCTSSGREYRKEELQ